MTVVAVIDQQGWLEKFMKFRNEPLHVVIRRLDVFNRQLDYAQTAWLSQPCWMGSEQ